MQVPNNKSGNSPIWLRDPEVARRLTEKLKTGKEGKNETEKNRTARVSQDKSNGTENYGTRKNQWVLKRSKQKESWNKTKI